MEPKPAMVLNNKTATLESTVAAEEQRVLKAVCGLLAAAMEDIDEALRGTTAIDLAVARAAHGRCASGATCAVALLALRFVTRRWGAVRTLGCAPRREWCPWPRRQGWRTTVFQDLGTRRC